MQRVGGSALAYEIGDTTRPDRVLGFGIQPVLRAPGLNDQPVPADDFDWLERKLIDDGRHAPFRRIHLHCVTADLRNIDGLTAILTRLSSAQQLVLTVDSSSAPTFIYAADHFISVASAFTELRKIEFAGQWTTAPSLPRRVLDCTWHNARNIGATIASADDSPAALRVLAAGWARVFAATARGTGAAPFGTITLRGQRAPRPRHVTVRSPAAGSTGIAKLSFSHEVPVALTDAVLGAIDGVRCLDVVDACEAGEPPVEARERPRAGGHFRVVTSALRDASAKRWFIEVLQGGATEARLAGLPAQVGERAPLYDALIAAPALTVLNMSLVAVSGDTIWGLARVVGEASLERLHARISSRATDSGVYPLVTAALSSATLRDVRFDVGAEHGKAIADLCASPASYSLPAGSMHRQIVLGLPPATIEAPPAALASAISAAERAAQGAGGVFEVCVDPVPPTSIVEVPPPAAGPVARLKRMMSLERVD